MSFLVHKVSKLSKNNLILDRVSLYVSTGSLVALLGPSGSGKSTLLRVIAGLDFPTNGSIWLNGRDVTNVPIQYRQMGFVFQNFALFKHMNVAENICFGLKMRNLPGQQIIARMEYFLDSLRISDIAYQYPSQLSGGQKQRVALARSLAIMPSFLLLDEPFGALDGELRRHLSKWLKAYLKDNEITAIMVTHDQKEAALMADEILVLKEGHLVQQGKPQVIYDNPINQFVGNFLGTLVKAPNSLNLNGQLFSSDSNLFARNPVWAHTLANRSPDKYHFFLRPHELCLQSEEITLSFSNQIDQKASLALIQTITYRRHLVYVELFVPIFEWKFAIQVGYSAFQELKIRFLNQKLYIKPRLKVLQRGYPIEKELTK